MAKARIRELISLRDVWLSVAVGSLEVWLHGLCKAGVGAISDLQRLLAVWVGFEGLDAVGDDWIRGEVVDEFGGRLLAVGHGLRHLVGSVRHCLSLESG